MHYVPSHGIDSFVLTGNIEHYQHFDLVAIDHALLNDLLQKVNVPPINFPKDKRVISM